MTSGDIEVLRRFPFSIQNYDHDDHDHVGTNEAGKCLSNSLTSTMLENVNFGDLDFMT